MTMIYTVTDSREGLRLVGVEAVVTAKQAKLDRRHEAWAHRMTIPVSEFELTAPAAIAMRRAQTERALAYEYRRLQGLQDELDELTALEEGLK